MNYSCFRGTIFQRARKGVGTMASTPTNLTIPIDPELKAQAKALFDELGLSLSGACNIFLRQAVREGRIPFEITLNSPAGKNAAPSESKK